MVCNSCKAPVEAAIFEHNGKIVCYKNCIATEACIGLGEQKVTLSSDARYWSQAKDAKTSSPKGFSALAVDVISECNMRCPTCIAGSEPGLGNVKALSVIKDEYQASRGRVNGKGIIFITGGEPTLHPELSGIIDAAIKSGYERVFLITNGVKMAKEPAFCKSLELHKSHLEIYLQFDSLRPDVLTAIRGEDLRHIRQRALENLAQVGLDVSLVCVVKQGLNEDECGEIINYATNWPNVRGVTFQPLKLSGRSGSYIAGEAFTDLGGTRRAILEKMTWSDNYLVPLPDNPENVSIGYFERSGGCLRVFTDEVLTKLTATNEKRIFALPSDLGINEYSRVFRVAIVSWLDVFTMNREGLSKALIGVCDRSRNVIPLDYFYAFPDSDHPELFE